MNKIAKIERIENRIYTIRGQKVMLDSDLAALYEVEIKALNQAVKRNKEKFPVSFMFQLTLDEWEDLRSQFVTLRNDIRKFKPYAFTEHGVLMIANVIVYIFCEKPAEFEVKSAILNVRLGLTFF